MDSDLGIKLFVSGFLFSDVDSNGNTQSFLLDDLVDILQDLNNLRHDNDLLNDLFQNVRNLNDLFSA